MIAYRINTDIEEAVATLRDLGRSDKLNRKYILKQIGKEAAKVSKKAYKSAGLKKQSKSLYNSITSWMKKDGKTVYVGVKPNKVLSSSGPNGPNNTHVPTTYGYKLSHGYTVNAKSRLTKWERKKSGTVPGRHIMQFITSDNHWVTVESYRVGHHDFVKGPVSIWMNGPVFREKLDLIIEKRVRQIEKANEKKRLAAEAKLKEESAPTEAELATFIQE